MRRVLSPRTTTLLGVLGFVGGLLVKYFMLFDGGPDMAIYEQWGEKALASGLVRSYLGIYFPLQYQIFQACAWIAAHTGYGFPFVSKLCSLLFDVGTFLLLLMLLKRRGANPTYAWIYWIHPWFLSVFSLGYIDFQFSFFVVLSIYCLTGTTTRHFLIAGIPLGCAFVMKPQAQILLIATAAYGTVHYARTKDWRPLGMMVCPVVLWLGYEAFFTASRFRSLGWSAAAVLPRSYLQITNVMPALTAQMPNLWYPIAYLLKPPEGQIYAVSDRIELLPYLSAKFVAAAVVLGLVFVQVLRSEKDVTLTVTDKFVAMFGLATLAVPFVMTSAHENHLFLGSVFLTLFLGTHRPRLFKLAIHTLLIIQFLNIYGLYGRWPSAIATLLTSTYSLRLALMYSLISLPCFLLVFSQLLPWKTFTVQSGQRI